MVKNFQKTQKPKKDKKTPIVIGITGTMAAGKDTIAAYLQTKGFIHHSLSDILREELKKENLPENVDNLLALGNCLRKKFGAGILGKKILEKIKKNKEEKVAVTSIRHPAEIEELKKMKNFFLLAVDAPIRLRYLRAQKRNRQGDRVSFEKFKAQEKLQLQNKGSAAQILNCMNQANYKIINDKTFADLYAKVDKILTKIEKNL